MRDDGIKFSDTKDLSLVVCLIIVLLCFLIPYYYYGKIVPWILFILVPLYRIIIQFFMKNLFILKAENKQFYFKKGIFSKAVRIKQDSIEKVKVEMLANKIYRIKFGLRDQSVYEFEPSPRYSSRLHEIIKYLEERNIGGK